MSYSIIMAVLVVIATVVALVKKIEARLVLLTAGLVMALLSGDPMAAFKQFDKSMSNGALIIAICSAMGFAGVISLTKCDLHLVALLTKPLRKIGFLLLPACIMVTSVVALAIPSTAGCVAAVAPTLVPLMVRSGFHPAAAAAAVVCSLTPAFLNPGVSHNVFIAKLAGMEVMEFIGKFYPYTIGFTIFILVAVSATCLLFYRDYNPAKTGEFEEIYNKSANTGAAPELPANPNVAYAIAPLVPVMLLLAVSFFTTTKISVSTAMIVGMVYAFAVTRTSPEASIKRFFDGMGRGYGSILGIIIAAGVFAAGLRAAGVVDAFINYLTSAQDIAKIGAASGPYLLGVMTGSGDAAAFAFNEAVTPHAAQFGLTVDGLGYLAAIAAHFGRMSSPLAGGLILAAGIAGVSPVDIVKRTIPAMLTSLVILFFLV